MQGHDALNEAENGVMLVSSEEIPRTQKQRKKNWKCVFPNCNEPVKTRFNCYAHVWDAHLRQYYTQNYPDMYPTTAFKKTQNKTPMKSLCEKYMIQLVEKPNSKEKGSSETKQQNSLNEVIQQIPIIEQNTLKTEQNMTYTISPDQTSNGVREIEMSSPNQSNEISLPSPSRITNNPEQLSESNYPFAFLSEYQFNNQFITNNYHISPTDQPIQQFQPTATIAIEETNQQNPNIIQDNSDFIKIEQITTQLKRLHVFGEIFAENGYLVRSDARSKTDIQTIENALNSVTSLVGKKYAYKNEPNKIKYGFIAQEVQEVIPDLVQKDESGNLSVDYLGVIPYIVEALKTIHDNSVSLENSSRKEYTELSQIVEDAVLQLQMLMEEKGKHIFLEKESRASTLLTFDIFGPPIVVLLMGIMFSILSIVIPFFVPYLFFTLGVLVVVTIVLWTVVIAQRKQLKDFFVFRIMKLRWLKSQFFVWFSILTLIHVSLLISILLGYGGLIMTAVYIIFFTLLAAVTYILHISPKLHWKFTFTVSLFILSFILTIICSILLTIFQPFISLNIREMNKPYHVNIRPNEPITPMVLSSPPWNCFSPQIQSDIPLPQNLTIVMPSSSTPNSVSPTVRGIVSDDISTNDIEFYIVCSGLIKVSYGKVTLKSCETKTNEKTCLNNKCGWCSSTKKCGFCEHGGEFCDNDDTHGC
ncbi:hypothetical protein CL6EHI_083660 [Entamoeba histolytica]|uniref:Peptidase S74 domain-containing protein n=3 Tax=Entamoeba histolytica TaxID=5759 RepID=C4M950_ENTH1|nr:hypothetical protein EHI_083660 [Entamoeba histolytica HM-1:IMSS]EAL49035.1 hypothetical protein EHI_083660 [Entamoeba histolytica HM-1:IMSS]EMD48420.1 Hypothetical protein EHI5A_037180 [Entamoeba histolytica KU27]GAT98171.1 hypothetical protein CL6EHI_083660 [Entamoeba histolytica]|eukprot:XP_654427.1 hypothetical protein EHI_083660 [Entamoeba histolytica HM-1:IMSS]